MCGDVGDTVLGDGVDGCVRVECCPHEGIACMTWVHLHSCVSVRVRARACARACVGRRARAVWCRCVSRCLALRVTAPLAVAVSVCRVVSISI